MIATAVEYVTASARQREHILGLFTLVYWTTVILAQVVDEKTTRLGGTFARSEQLLLFWDEVKCLDLFFKAFEHADICETDNIPHHDVFLCSRHQKIALLPNCN